MLQRVSVEEVVRLCDRAARSAVDSATLAAAGVIVDDVRCRGIPALREHAERLGDIVPGASLLVDRAEMDAALARLAPADRGALAGMTADVRAFAEMQRASVRDAELPVPGGVLRQSVVPVERAGCYAPGGRYPLPSSVVMTAGTARAAGVAEVVVASPRPVDATLAAAALAGADRVLAVGGAQAIAAMAFGINELALRPCDAVVGPGNRWVTAAKQLVSGAVRIDMLAGPSEVLILADSHADAATIAADLLAQAEHDVDARANLVTTSAALAERVDAELARQLATLPTRSVAERAIVQSWCCVVAAETDAVRLADAVAPEHLEVHFGPALADAERVAAACRHYGAVFVGDGAAEVVGDYGVGPNHTLPTGGTARFSGGLSVFDFLRVRSAVVLERGRTPAALYERTARLARLEGLEAHARAAEARTPGSA